MPSANPTWTPLPNRVRESFASSIRDKVSGDKISPALWYWSAIFSAPSAPRSNSVPSCFDARPNRFCETASFLDSSSRFLIPSRILYSCCSGDSLTRSACDRLMAFKEST